MFSNLIATGDTQINSAFANEGGNIGSWEEDESNRKVLNESNVETIMAVKLNVGASQQVEAGLIEAAL